MLKTIEIGLQTANMCLIKMRQLGFWWISERSLCTITGEISLLSFPGINRIKFYSRLM